MEEASSQIYANIAKSVNQTEQGVALPPLADENNLSIGLALSGGGFRATLFHLGVVERLRDIGRLKDIKTVTSVSGGSILASHLVLNWEKYNGSDKDFLEVRNELLEFIRSDLRNHIIRRYPTTFSAAIFIYLIRTLGLDAVSRRLAALLPTSKTDLLADYYNRRLLKGKSLSKLQGEGRPTLRILVTNLTRIGDNTFFDSDGYHVQQSDRQIDAPCSLIPLGIAVAASSAFPAVFEALEITPELLSVRHSVLNPTRQFLTDGGAYDNLGMHQLLSEHRKSPFHCLIISDASGGHDLDDETDYQWLLPRLTRVSSILYRQVNELQKRRAKNHPQMIILDIRTVIESGYSLAPHLQSRLEFIRTDLDIFSPLEMHCLVGHGYAVAKHLFEGKPELLPTSHLNTDTRSKWRDIPNYPATEDDEHLLSEINIGTMRRLRLFNARDWIVWFYISIVILIVSLLIWLTATKLVPYWKTYNNAKLTESSIGTFLIKPGDEFRSTLKTARTNFYFVGLTNQYTLSNNKQIIADAINREIKVQFFLYLPEEDAVAGSGQISEGALEEYIEVYKRYRPHGDNYLNSMRNAWKDFDPSFTAHGSSSDPPSEEELKRYFAQYFYTEQPKGWLVIVDVDQSFTFAKEIYWFPYLAEARELDRPGLKLSSDSALGKETLKWLSHLVNDNGTRLAKSQEAEKWQRRILEFADRNQTNSPDR